MALKRCGRPVARTEAVYFTMADGSPDPVVCRVWSHALAKLARIDDEALTAGDLERVFLAYRDRVEAAAEAKFARGVRSISVGPSDFN